MKVMITGANGFLGQHLYRCLHEAYEVFATGRGARRLPFENVQYAEGDITNKEAFYSVTDSIQPDVIIHTAAMTRPDECNNDKARCDEVNIGGTETVVAAAKRLGNPPHIIYTSTDFIFGEGGPHDEDGEPAPLNYYGLSKWKAEKIMEQYDGLYTIMRPVFMYGDVWPGLRPTFLHWVKQSLEEGRSIKVVNDQLRTPTFVRDICRGIQSIIEKKAGGIFHLAGEDRLTPYEMAVKLGQLLDLDTSLIIPVTAETFPEPVQRAKKSGLLIGKAKAILDYKPLGFSEALPLIFTDKKHQDGQQVSSS